MLQGAAAPEHHENVARRHKSITLQARAFAAAACRRGRDAAPKSPPRNTAWIRSYARSHHTLAGNQ